MSYQNAQRVPAWKRLGLKLKGPASAESPAPASPANATPTTSAPTPQTPSSANAGVKRKQPPSATAPIRRAPEKRQRTDAVSSSPKKTVKFTEDTKAPEDKKPTAEPKKAPKKPKEKKQKSKPAAAQPAEPFNLEPSLAYLRQWDTDRESWKFNKNHQTLLIKHFFDTGRIPASEVPIFLAYIRDLKGFVRTRLREEAAAIKKKDMADGAAGFAQVKEKADKDSKLELYEEVLSKLLQLGQPDGESSATNPDGNGKRSFDEAEFTAEEMDVDVKQRVVKRMRAELVLQELSESEESTTSAATTTTTSSATETAEKAEPAADKGAKLNDGTQPLKRRRLRKSRTADISDDSSSESESDSDSDSDSSSDSSDDEEDEEMPLANGEGAESSSSSSSSESESDSDDSSDSDSESGAGAKVEEAGDGSSSDSDDSG